MARDDAPKQAENKGAKSGVQPGECAPDPKHGKAPRPVEEEDTFGGAERAKKNGDVQSERAKP
ncbi:MAG: hypothetical protein R3C16_12675 [Hyphomonadaceae bacterium]